MDLIGLSIIIITIVGCVHFVYKRGKIDGISQGRLEVLEENIKRTDFVTKQELSILKCLGS